MQAKGLIALIAATIVVILAAFIVSIGGGRTSSEARGGEPVLADVASHLADVAVLKITDVAGTMTVRRSAAGDKQEWGIAEKGGYPADPIKVRQILLGFAELKLVESKTHEAKFYTRLDVEDPGTDRGKESNHSRLVELDDGAGKKLGELIVGKRRPDSLGTGADGLYIRRPGDPQAWLAQGSVDLPAETKDWLDKKILSLPASRIRTVTLTHADGTTLVLGREKAEDKFTVADAPADSKFKSDSVVSEPAGVLENLELADVRPAADIAVPAEGVSRAEWQTFDGLTVTGETFERDGANWLRFTARASEEKSKAEADELTAKLSPWTYSVFQYKTTAMKTKLADLLEPPKGS
jgi:hypothetical protein